MSDRVEDRDENFSYTCPDRYDIVLYFSNREKYNVPKYVKKSICLYAQLSKKTLKDYIWSKPKELQDILPDQRMEKLVDVKIYDKNDYMEKMLQRIVGTSVNRYLNQNSRNPSKRQAKLPESKGHVTIKNEVVEYLRSLDVESYPEIVFYENAFADYYQWEIEERRSNSNADGIFGYGSVGYGNFKQRYGRQIRVDVAGWISNPDGQFNYPVIAVEVMKSSNVRKEILNLKRIYGSSVVYAVIIDVYGELYGTINNIPIVPLNIFKKGIRKRIELVKEAIMAGKDEQEIFAIGGKFNSGKDNRQRNDWLL